MEASDMAEASYDVVVIGAGPVGLNVVQYTRAAELSVVAVERELVGGECSYWACVPSKALLRPVIAVGDVRRVDGARQALTGRIDVASVFGRRDRAVNNWDDTGPANLVASLGSDLIRGHARLAGTRRVVVTTVDGESITLTARHAVVVCIGSGPALPDLPGIADAHPWTNRQGTGSGATPNRL